MADEGIPRTRSKWRVRTAFLAIPLAVLLLWQFAMVGIRAYVSSRIEGTVGSEVPAFALRDRDGRVWTAADLRGRTTVLNFFRSQCSACTAESAAIRAFAAGLDPSRVQVLGVMMDAVQGYPPAVSAATLARYDYRHPVLMADSAFADAFHGAGWAQVTPVTYIVDAKGVVQRSMRGRQDVDSLRAAVR